MKIFSKKIILSLLTSSLIATSLSAYDLPAKFFDLPKEKQKEILLNDDKMKAYLTENGISIKKETVVAKVEEVTPAAKKFVYYAAPLIDLEEAKKTQQVPQLYDGPLSFTIPLLNGNTVTTNVGFGNGGNLIVPKKFKIKLKDAKVIFPNGKAELIDTATFFIEESECEVITLEMENSMVRKDVEAKNKFVHIPIAMIEGVLYMDLTSTSKTNTGKIIAIDLSTQEAVDNIDLEGMISEKSGLNLSDATMDIKTR